MDKNKLKVFNLIAVIAIVTLCFAVTPVTLQNDTYYTISIGENIVRNGIDMHDPFSWHDLSYTYPHWLYDLLTYFIYSIGGMGGIYAATVALSCALGLVMYFTNVKLTKNNFLSFILTFIGIYMMRDYIAARAQLVTFILFILIVFFIEKYMETKKKRYGVFLVIISILIANLHCAVWPFVFVLFMPYIAEYIIVFMLEEPITFYVLKTCKKLQLKILLKRKSNDEKIISVKEKIEVYENDIRKFKEFQEKKKLNKPYKVIKERNNAVKGLILIAIICAFTGILTPIGDTPYTYLIKTMEGNTTENINEHLPMVLIEHTNAIITFSVLIFILTFTDTKIKLRDLLMIGGLLILSLMTKRQFSMFVIVGIFIFNKLISSFLENRDIKFFDRIIEVCISPVGKIVFIIIVELFNWYLYKDKIDDPIINSSTYPVEAAEFINNNLDVQNIKLFNEYNYGSYLLYKKIPVFIDSRADLYAPEFNGKKDIFSDFLNITGLSANYTEKFNEYGVTHVMLYQKSKLNEILFKDVNYKVIYSDTYFVIYERLDANEKVI